MMIVEGASLLPDAVTPFAAGAIIAMSFFTSLITAAMGVGGGLVLLAVMSALLPPVAVIPVHGAAQLGSNVSRFLFLGRHTVWPVIGWFVFGGVLGALLGARIYVDLPAWVLRGGVAIFILVMVWAPKPKGFSPHARAYALTGGVSSLLTMFVGATGPFVAGMLSTTPFNRQEIVSTHAAAMIAQHGLKTIAFGAIGFAFAQWAVLIGAIVLAGFVGSGVGARILVSLPEDAFKRGLKWILTLTSIYLIVRSLAEAL